MQQITKLLCSREDGSEVLVKGSTSMATVTSSKFTFERLEDRIAPSALLLGLGLGVNANVGVGGGGDCHPAAPKDDFSSCAPPKDDFSSSCRPCTPALGLKVGVGLNAILGLALGGRH